MDIQVILSVALTLLSTQADNCVEDQQCTHCSSSTQYCIADCFSGYFGLKCKSRCSKQCINSKCSLTLSGTYNCSEGCVPGFYGSRCKTPCTLPKNRCTKCPDKCNGTFCHLTSSCVSGCQDKYYGSNCKNCSPRCRQCNRMTGRCSVCHYPYHGVDCEYTCEHCSTTDCVQTCAPGLYGSMCSKRCNQNCQAYPAKSSILPSNSSTSCISECQRYSGECINGCADDLSDPHCSTPIKCNPTCLSCNETGSCVEGCMSGYYGDDCKPCPGNCFNYTCNQNNGSCDNGCIQGHYGQSCHLPCINCPGGVCHPSTGICDSVQSTINDWTIGTTTALLVLVFGIIVTGCIVLFKRFSAKRDHQRHESIHTVRSGQLETGEYYPVHQYWDIEDYDEVSQLEEQQQRPAEEEDYEEVSQRQGQQHGSAEEKDNSDAALPALADIFPGPHGSKDDDSNPVLSVLADYFPGALATDDNNDDDASSSSASGFQSYTPLMRDVFVDDPKTVVTYLSPTEDNT